MENKKDVDFYDDHHLKIIDESYLDKRILPFESALNMRDIGGYTNNNNQRIKWDKIYRGEELVHLSDEDQKKFDNIGINYVFDFREPHNVERKPDHLAENINYVHLPVLNNLDNRYIDFSKETVTIDLVNEFMQSLYLSLAQKRAHMFADVLKVLRDDKDAKIYIHCTNGKDRTGFMIALIMLLAGIDEEKIISEYSLTNLKFDKAFQTLAQDMATSVQYPKEDLKPFFGVDPEWLKVQLDYIKDNYDSVDDYLLKNTDLTKEDLNKIRENILEDA